MNNNKQFVNVIMISSDWEIQHRKPLLNNFIIKSNNWSYNVIIQQPVCLLAHIISQFKRKILGLIKRKYKTKKLDNGAIIFTPLTIFCYSLWLKLKFTAYVDVFLLSKQLNAFIKNKFQNKIIILWVFFPCHYLLIKKLKYNFLIYDFYDNFELHHEGYKLTKDTYYNELLIKESDLILCLAKQTYERANSINSNAYYFPSGNNFELLSNNKYNHLTPEIDNITLPMIVYLGAIRKWIDFDLLKKTISSCSEIIFVFIGFINRDTRKEFNELLLYPNTLFINYIEQEKLSAYLNKFKAGIIPFKVNKFMESVFPNKFLEYMAAGLPVITTALKELESYSNIIHYSKSQTEFIDYCKNATKDQLNYNRNELIRIAKENSWSVKAEKLNQYLYKRLTSNNLESV